MLGPGALVVFGLPTLCLLRSKLAAIDGGPEVLMGGALNGGIMDVCLNRGEPRGPLYEEVAKPCFTLKAGLGGAADAGLRCGFGFIRISSTPASFLSSSRKPCIH